MTPQPALLPAPPAPRLGVTERLLRSVIDSLDGALCIVGSDGTILGANRRWLDWLVPLAGHGPGRAQLPVATAPSGTATSDFFVWCRCARGMREVMAQTAHMVREIITAPPTTEPTDETQPPDVTEPRSIKGRIRHGDVERWVIVRVHRITDHPEARAVVSLVDITEATRTSRALRLANDEARRLALVARAMDHPVVITRPHGTIEWANEPFTVRSGYSQHEAVGHRRSDLVDADCRRSPEFVEFMDRVDSGEGADGEFRMTALSGAEYWNRIEVRPIVESGRVTRLVWVERDVTSDRDNERLLNAALARSEGLAADLSHEKSLLSGVLSAVPQMIFWKGDDGAYLGCNAAYVRFRGRRDAAEFVGRTDADLGLDDSLTRQLTDLESVVMTTGRAVVDRKIDVVDGADGADGTRSLLVAVLPLDLEDGAAHGVIGVGADVTHARDLERKLAQANRLESIGQLASGIAHEINTPIQYVTDNTQFIDEAASALIDATTRIQALSAGSTARPRDTLRAIGEVLATVDVDFLREEVPAALAACREGLTRVAEIVRAMKSYAHPGNSSDDTDINRAVASTVEVCRNEWKYVARVELHLDPGAGLVRCFEGDIKQVILNMVVNAAQAIGDDRRIRGVRELGTITVGTARGTDEFAITIADDGPGMAESISRRVFDPFFTTKPVGEGTGQGLALAHSVVVTNHRGHIDLLSAPGKGTTFCIRLPLHPSVPSDSDAAR